MYNDVSHFTKKYTRRTIILDRLDMLKQLVQIKDGHNILNKYISNHYDEIYSLYNILNDCKIKYKNIKFTKMIDDNESFTFICSMSDEDYITLSKFSNEHKKILCDSRKRLSIEKYFKFTVSIDNDDRVYIKFER